MIYLDSSIVLARILDENRRPSDAFWDAQMVSSRLLEYEVWRRVQARGLAASQGEFVREILSRVAFVELTPAALERARDPLPAGIRTFDALHLASADYLRGLHRPLRLASYDKRMLAAARSLGIPAFEPD